MAFRASNVVPQSAYQRAKQVAINLRGTLQSANSAMQAGSVDYAFLYRVARTLTAADADFTELRSTPGLAAYAKDQENDANYDVAAEFVALQSSIDGAISWLDANLPRNVTVSAPSTWTDPNVIENSFTPAQTSGLRSTLQTVIDAVA